MSFTRLRVAAATVSVAGLALGLGSIAYAEPVGAPSASASASASATASASVSPSVSASVSPSAAADASAAANPSTPAPTGPAAQAAASVPTTDPACANPKTLTIFNINDFHGRIDTATKLFTVVEQAKTANPDNVMLLSAGDNIGASTFVSMSQDDIPTIEVLNAAGLQASSVGNHEFDGGFAKLRDEYIGGQNVGGRNPGMVKAAFPYLASNLTGVNPPIAPYTVINQNGVRVAVIGSEVEGLTGLVSPAGLAGITEQPSVPLVNQTADQIKQSGQADIVIAEVHNNIQSGFDKNVDVIFNGHTHETYANLTADNGQPVLQAASYGTKLARVDILVGTGNVVCGTPTGQIVNPAAAADLTNPAIAAINTIVTDANAKAAVIGNQVIGQACGPIQRSVLADGLTENRGGESTATDLVAQMFYERLSNGDPNFIGMQNPGGTRTDIAAGDITYAQANAVLPFANTLMTTQITGAQLKTVLEEQWQRNADGTVPARPYLQLGLSKNVTYTYDESLPEGSRITSISVNGMPYDPAATYTVGSGSFLISGGDQFWELGKGKNPTDTGKIDLSEWVDWIKATTAAKGNICSSPARQAVSLKATAAALSCTAASTVVVGQPLAGGVATDNLNFWQKDPRGVPLEQTVTAYAGDQAIGTATVADGFATLSLTSPADGTAALPVTLKSGNGTTVYLGSLGITTTACAAAVEEPTPSATPTPAPSASPSTVASATPMPTPTSPANPGLPNTGGEPASLLVLGLLAVAGGTLVLRKAR